MLNAVEGVYRNGKVDLAEVPPGVKESRVLVTFLPNRGPIDLAELGVSRAEAAELRASLETFAEDWDRPEMDVYNDL